MNNFSKFKALIFDFDGVLVQSEELHYQAAMQALVPIKLSLGCSAYLKKYAGLPDEDLFTRLLTDERVDFSGKDIARYVDLKNIFYNDLAQTLKISIDVENLIHKVRAKGLILGVCTASSKSNIDTILYSHLNQHLVPYFQAIITKDSVTLTKPHPDPYLLTAKLLKVSPEDCLVIEDSPTGIQAAKAAGMTVIALTSTHQKKVLLAADYWYNNPREIELALS